MSVCYVVGAGEPPLLYLNPENCGCLIAADGGVNRTSGNLPDICVGDFDSLGYVPDGKNVVRLPVEKDVTDMMYAVSLGMDKGFKSFVIYGGTGGRPDHTMANISLLCNLSKKGCVGYLVGDGYIVTAITDDRLVLPLKQSGTVSVFAAGDKAEGVCETGLKYGLDNHTLTFDNPLGVSNAFIGQKATVSVKKGTLVIMWEDSDLKNFIDKLT